MPHTLLTLLALLFLLPTAARAEGRDGLAKLSPYVRRVALQTGAALTRGGRERFITAFVSTADASAIEQAGGTSLARWGRLHIARLPIGRLRHLAALPAVTAIEAAPHGHACLDTTVIVTRAAALRAFHAPSPARGEGGLTGRGVVVGVQDIGFDLTHPTFRTPDQSRLRIVSLWDQLAREGGRPLMAQAADGGEAVPGRLHEGEEALLTIGHSADAALVTHGTHTASTAAGSGAEGAGRLSPYVGLAPEADICLVANLTSDNASLVPDDEQDLFTSATDILGFKHIFDTADSLGRPCVVSFSEGAHDDFYNSRLACEAIDSLLRPGHIICASAGNEGWKPAYINKPKGQERAGAFLAADDGTALYTTLSDTPPALALTFYPDHTEPLTKVFDMSAYAPDSIYADTIAVGGLRYALATAIYPSCYDAERMAAELLVAALDTAALTMPIALTLSGEGQEVECFGVGGWFTTSLRDPSLHDATASHNILFPASAPGVICVGATAWRTGITNCHGNPMGSNLGTGGARVPYSSQGPTLDGQTKPDVMAPGANVVAAHSSWWAEAGATAWERLWDVRRFAAGGREYSWAASSGTSMAAPVVAGIIALWLQLCPTLSTADIREVFAATCRRGTPLLPYPNNSTGYGEIDAEAGADYIRRNITALTRPAAPAAPAATYDLAGRKLSPASPRPGVSITLRDGVARKTVRRH